MSGLLEHGDEILEIDGAAVTKETFAKLLIGADIPGSTVVITVKKVGPMRYQRTINCTSKQRPHSLAIPFAICKSFPALNFMLSMVEITRQRAAP
jgi:hypothetical protein